MAKTIREIEKIGREFSKIMLKTIKMRAKPAKIHREIPKIATKTLKRGNEMEKMGFVHKKTHSKQLTTYSKHSLA